MPPLSAEMKVGERNVKLPDILPGVPISLTDADELNPNIVVVSCNPQDDGGIVYRQRPESTREILNRVFRLIRSDVGDVEAVIGRNETVDLPITTKFGKATLTITHY